ncbi:hypothetical protein HMPREF9694_05504 [Klebsiella michiganensis]|nr:hypothetical protein HMPREF9694_05504 [Klebsiella michiganensis]
MKKMLVVMPALLTGCTGFSPLRSSSPEPQVPALVFVDGQIRSAAETVAHTQQQVRATVPAPGRTAPVPPTPVTAAPASSGVPATSSSTTQGTLTGPAAPAATTAAGLRVTGSPQKPAVINLPGVSNLTTEQWIRRILPDGWQLKYENALRQKLTSRHKTIWQNDEWTRVLERLLVSQGIQGHLDWNARTLTLSRPGLQSPDAIPTGTPAAPPSTVPHNPFRDSREATTPSASPAPVPVRVTGPAWKAEPGSTLRTTLTQWASTASCSGGKWLVIWPVSVDYPVSAPLTFNGPFEQVMTELFTLYQKAAIPLYAGISRQQCVISVSDKPFPGGTP